MPPSSSTVFERSPMESARERFEFTESRGGPRSPVTSAPLSTSGLSRSRIGEPVVAMVSTYPPTQCGLATFAAASRAALLLARPHWNVPIVRAQTDENGGSRARPVDAPEVAACWVADSASSLASAAASLANADCVVVQHEYGIFGGVDGCQIIDLLDATSVPTIAILHTVLDAPSLGQRRVIAALARRCSQLVVMSDSARDRLLDRYPVSADNVAVIPHGAHEPPYVAPLSKDRIPVALTWGLVGPGKGLERAIDAIAELRDRGITVRYNVTGETHPKVRQRDGERYRESLMQRAVSAGVDDLVHFDSQYRPVSALLDVIADADVVIVPYDTREQVTSGVLVEALAAGKPIVATAFPHAVEALRSGAGIVVGHEHSTDMADAIASIVCDRERALAMSAVALREGARVLWPAVGESLAATVEHFVPRLVTGPTVTIDATRRPGLQERWREAAS